jgi:hypothetical protein
VLTAQGDRHLTIENPVGNRGRQLFTEDRLDRALVCDNNRPVLLEYLSASDVIDVRVGHDDVSNRHVEAAQLRKSSGAASQLAIELATPAVLL